MTNSEEQVQPTTRRRLCIELRKFAVFEDQSTTAVYWEHEFSWEVEFGQGIRLIDLQEGRYSVWPWHSISYYEEADFPIPKE